MSENVYETDDELIAVTQYAGPGGRWVQVTNARDCDEPLRMGLAHAYSAVFLPVDDWRQLVLAEATRLGLVG